MAFNYGQGQLNADEWLFVVPKEAKLGPNIERTQIRIKTKMPDDISPGFYTTSVSLRQVQ